MQQRDVVLKQVQAAIERAAPGEGANGPLSVTLQNGTVLVEGEVADVGAKKRMVKAAAGVEGVRVVDDRLRLAGQPVGDGATRDAVCKLLLRDTGFRNCGLRARVKEHPEILRQAGNEASGSIEVAVVDGVVSLSGQVISLSHKRLAGVLAWWARGCRDVDNGLEVVPPEEDNDGEIVDALQLVFEADPFVHADQIGVGSCERVVTLEGSVASDSERRRAEMDAWCLFAVDGVINRLEVR